jgi:hypothetical protein
VTLKRHPTWSPLSTCADHSSSLVLATLAGLSRTGRYRLGGQKQLAARKKVPRLSQAPYHITSSHDIALFFSLVLGQSPHHAHSELLPEQWNHTQPLRCSSVRTHLCAVLHCLPCAGAVYVAVLCCDMPTSYVVVCFDPWCCAVVVRCGWSVSQAQTETHPPSTMPCLCHRSVRTPRTSSVRHGSPQPQGWLSSVATARLSWATAVTCGDWKSQPRT